MAVSFDNSVSATGNAGSISPSLTIAGTNVGVVVGVLVIGGTITGTPTFDGVNMTLLSSTGSLYLYGVAGTSTGSRALSATFSGASDYFAGIVSLNGVDQATPFDTAVVDSSASTSTSVSATVTSAAGEMVVDVAYMVITAMAAAGGQTERAAQDSVQGGFISGGMSTKDGAGSVTMQWDSLATAGTNRIIAVAVNASAGGSSPVLAAVPAAQRNRRSRGRYM